MISRKTPDQRAGPTNTQKKWKKKRRMMKTERRSLFETTGVGVSVERLSTIVVGSKIDFVTSAY